LDAAIRIVDAEGLEALTLRRLGPEVGVSYTAVYTYFKTREDLIAALVDRISEEIIAGIAPSGDSARDQLIAIAMSSRRALARHPRLATGYVSDQSDAVVGNQATLSVVALLESSGIKGRDVVTAYRVLENYVFGSTIFDFGAAPNHLSIRRRRYRATSHPEFKAVGLSDKSVGQHNDEAFEKGLALILDGLGI
jgi:AcrR family transcriptional regulator